MINRFLIFGFLAIFAWLGFSFYNAYKPLPRMLWGQIEAQSYSISSKVAGRIDKIFVKKGDILKQGDLVFNIHSPELEAKINQAKAGEKVAKALSKQADNGARKQEIEALKDTWQKAKTALSLAEVTYKRLESLYKEGVISEQKKDEAYTKFQASKFNEQAALKMYEMAKEGTRVETKTAAKEKEKMAASAVAEVQAYADDLKIKSFHNGEVSDILLQEGELASTGFPVVMITDMNNSWLVFHVREDELYKFQKGSSFKAKIPALNNEIYEFKVDYISVLGDYATWRASDLRKEFDMRTFEIEARPVKYIENLRVGMSVLVEQ